MKPPTEEQIKQEAEKLAEMLPRIRPFSLFGEDNRAKVRAELRVLTEDLSEDEIDEQYEDDDSLRDSALTARAWMDGDEETSPTENWRMLVQ